MGPAPKQTPKNIEALGAFLHPKAFPTKACRGVIGVGEALRKFAKKLHGEIKTTTDPSYREAEGGSLRIKPDNSFEIWISPYTSHTRDNFTIAHELGHYFLHWLGLPEEERENGGRVFYRYGRDTDERQANRFAAAFLMPEEEFKKALEHYGQSPYLLSMRFGVSEEAVETRIKSLGLHGR